MPRFELTIEIARPPEEVFAYLTDVAMLPEWQSSAVSAEADGPIRKGACIRERRRFLGRDMKTELEVVEYDPPRCLDLTSRSGPATFVIHHQLEPSNGGTHLHVEVDVKVRAMMRLAAQGPLKLAERELRADFARLKELLEARRLSG